MDNHNQVIKLCGICGNKRVYIEYHSLNTPCKKRLAKNSARCYQTDREKIIARSKVYQENTKYEKKCHSQQIEELNIKVKELTRDMETIVLKVKKI